MTQIERIEHMERYLEFAKEAAATLTTALNEYDVTEKTVAALREYYDSKAWREDFEADEAGRLPRDLKRGVLSEDGIWNVLEIWRELKERLAVVQRGLHS